MTCSSIRGLAFASASLCCISAGMSRLDGGDVIGDLHGGGSGGISPAFANKELAIGDGGSSIINNDQDLADAGTAVAQMQQDGGTTFVDGGTKVLKNGGSSFVSDGSDPGDEDPRELEPA